MNTEYPKAEIEKPKPIKVRAATAAMKLLVQREHFTQVHGSSESWLVAAMNEAIVVLQIVAGEKSNAK